MVSAVETTSDLADYRSASSSERQHVSSGLPPHPRDARTRFMFIAIRSALRIMIAACEAGTTSLAVSENSSNQRAKYRSSMGKGKCAWSGFPF